MSIKPSVWVVFMLGATAVSAGGCGSDEPDCAEIMTSDLAVDTSSGAPVFSWEGDRVEYLDVYPGELSPDVYGGLEIPNKVKPVWGVLCQCQSDDTCDDSHGCLVSSVTFGEVPEVKEEVTEDGAAEPLVSGETYTVRLGSFCSGERIEDRDGETGFIGRKELSMSFSAP